jgi:hypothetical protein
LKGSGAFCHWRRSPESCLASGKRLPTPLDAEVSFGLLGASGGPRLMWSKSRWPRIAPSRSWACKTRCVCGCVRSFGERLLDLRETSSDPKVGAGGALRDGPAQPSDGWRCEVWLSFQRAGWEGEAPAEPPIELLSPAAARREPRPPAAHPSDSGGQFLQVSWRIFAWLSGPEGRCGVARGASPWSVAVV